MDSYFHGCVPRRESQRGQRGPERAIALRDVEFPSRGGCVSSSLAPMHPNARPSHGDAIQRRAYVPCRARMRQFWVTGLEIQLQCLQCEAQKQLAKRGCWSHRQLIMIAVASNGCISSPTHGLSVTRPVASARLAPIARRSIHRAFARFAPHESPSERDASRHGRCEATPSEIPIMVGMHGYRAAKRRVASPSPPPRPTYWPQPGSSRYGHPSWPMPFLLPPIRHP